MLDIISAWGSTMAYWITLHEVVFNKRGYSHLSCFKDDLQAHVQVYSLGLIFWLWSRPHYRCKDFQQDMIDNLRNVAVPGTGIPLSLFCHNWWICLFFVYFVNPLICFVAAVNKVRKGSAATGGKSLFKLYEDHLLHPQDWFSYWRLNCRLASAHSLLLKPAGYNLEDKWTFLKEGAAVGVPVSPFLDKQADLVVKNKNVEGGLGIHFFKNAVHGGDWIFQERLQNAKWLNTMLPSPAPLSTMRVITSSSWTMRKHGKKFEKAKYRVYDRKGDVVEDQTAGTHYNLDEAGGLEDAEKYIVARSAVLRLGRAGASTDHSSVLFDVDINSGKVLQGTSNQQWYKLGLHQAAPGASQVSALSLALLEGISSTMAANNPHSRKVVAELLKPLLSTGAILVGCYWKRKKNKSTFLGAAVGAPAPASEPDEPTGGTQCQAIILLLSRLSVASLTAAEVPPDDVLVSVEGLSSIIQDKYLLSVTWFVVHPECWPTLLRTVVHCLLYRVHVVHKGPLEDLLVLLVSDLDFPKLQEEIQSGEALASQEELNQLASLSRGDSGVANMAKGTGDSDTLPASAPRELDGVLQQVMMEIEALVGSQGSSIADAGTTFFAQFQAAKQASQSDGPGPFQQSFGARATSGTAKGRRSREVKLLLATVIQPLSAEIAKLQDPTK